MVAMGRYDGCRATNRNLFPRRAYCLTVLEYSYLFLYVCASIHD